MYRHNGGVLGGFAMNCKQCGDKVITEGNGCTKCGNEFCGYCCEFDNTPLCGDHLEPITKCGCRP